MYIFPNRGSLVLLGSFLLCVFLTAWTTINFRKDETDPDPVEFIFSSNRETVRVGEEFEITVIAHKRANWDTRFAHSGLGVDFRIKIATPDGFEQTGGNYRDLAFGSFSKENQSLVFKLRGKFNSIPASSKFILLRGTKESVELDRYLFRSELEIKVINSDEPVLSKNQQLRTSTAVSCSGYTFSEGQLIGSGGSTNVVVHIESGCAVAYWQGGNGNGRTHPDWLAQLTGKTIPDNILSSCVKWEGSALNCSSSPCSQPPSAPTISKTAGTTVCAANNQSVTLTASGCSGTVTWFKDGSQVGTGISYQTSSPGNYTASCAVNSCESNQSPSLLVSPTDNCGQPTGSVSCSGCTFSEGQLIGSGGSTNVVIHIESGCAVAYWQGGNGNGRTHPDWLAQLTGKTIPDNILSSCVKWEGSALNCSSSPCSQPPSAPTISKTAGTTVCAASNQSVTLAASGCSGTVTWFKDGSQVGTGISYQTSSPGNYTASCTVNSCESNQSPSLLVSQTDNCGQSTGSVSCSGYTFSEGQLIGSGGSTNVVIHIESGCAVAYWQGGNGNGRTHPDWLAQLTGKTIPDNILSSCVKWEGSALNCSSSPCSQPPSAPTISKTSGTTVCAANNQSVTLTASGCSGTVTWFKDGAQVGTGSSYITTASGNYSASCTTNGCVGAMSAILGVEQNADCSATNYNSIFTEFFRSRLASYDNNVLVHVGRGDQTLFSYANGVYNKDSQLSIMSASKIVTAAVIMSLVEDNRLSLDDKVSKYIASFNNDKQGITIRNLLSHTSGLLVDTPDDSRSDITLEQNVNNIATSTLLFSPGTSSTYGSAAFSVAARVAEIVDGKPWAQIFRDRIASKCAMGQAMYSPGHPQNPAAGYGIICSMNEYLGFIKMIYNKGVYNGTRVLSEASVRSIQADNTNGIDPTFGAGVWRVRVNNGTLEEMVCFSASGCYAWITLDKDYYGLIFTQSGFDKATPPNNDFRYLTREKL